MSAQGNRWTLTAPPPTWRELQASHGVLAGALGLEASDIGERPLWVKAGKEQLIVPKSVGTPSISTEVASRAGGLDKQRPMIDDAIGPTHDGL